MNKLKLTTPWKWPSFLPYHLIPVFNFLPRANSLTLSMVKAGEDTLFALWTAGPCNLLDNSSTLVILSLSSKCIRRENATLLKDKAYYIKKSLKGNPSSHSYVSNLCIRFFLIHGMISSCTSLGSVYKYMDVYCKGSLCNRKFMVNWWKERSKIHLQPWTEVT